MFQTILTSAFVACALGFAGDEPKSSTAKIVVHCKSEALIRGTSVLMRDLAAIETPDAELTARIGEIRIGNRPALGSNRVFPQSDIQRRLIVAGLEPARILMSGAGEVVAQPLSTTINASDITDITDPVLQATLELRGGDVEYELFGTLKSLRVPPGRFDLNLRAKLTDGHIRPSSATVELEIVVDDQVFKTVPVQYRLRHFVHALKSSRVIKKGEPLGQHNLMLERIETAPGSNMYLTSFELTDGMVAARDIQNARDLALGDLTKPAVVHRNDLVTLVSQRGRIQVTTKAIALEAGPIGARVQVRCLTNNRPVQAIVHGAGLVVIP